MKRTYSIWFKPNVYHFRKIFNKKTENAYILNLNNSTFQLLHVHEKVTVNVPEISKFRFCAYLSKCLSKYLLMWNNIDIWVISRIFVKKWNLLLLSKSLKIYKCRTAIGNYFFILSLPLYQNNNLILDFYCSSRWIIIFIVIVVDKTVKNNLQ